MRRGLLFAATERQVHVSFDDGDHWQPLRLNMAPSSVRDIIVKDDDLVPATHGRGFWILDDITPLRQLDAAAAADGAFLFKPQTATRVRWNMNTDTPLPPDEPACENPPDGAIIDYALKSDPAKSVTIEIVDGTGRVIRRYSSDDKGEYPTPESAPVPRTPRSLNHAVFWANWSSIAWHIGQPKWSRKASTTGLSSHSEDNSIVSPSAFTTFKFGATSPVVNRLPISRFLTFYVLRFTVCVSRLTR